MLAQKTLDFGHYSRQRDAALEVPTHSIPGPRSKQSRPKRNRQKQSKPPHPKSCRHPRLQTHRTLAKSPPGVSLPYAATVLLLLGVALTGWRFSVHHTLQQATEISLASHPSTPPARVPPDLAQSFRLDLTDALAQLPHVNVRASKSLDLVSLDQATHLDSTS